MNALDLTTKRGVMRLFLARYVAQEMAFLEGAHMSTEALALLKEVAGKRRASTQREMELLLRKPTLQAPSPRMLGKETPPGASLVTARTFPFKMREDVGATVKSLNKGGKFNDLLEALGRPSPDEWAVILERELLLGHKEGEKLLGQLSTAAGWMLERIRKNTRAFRIWAPVRAVEIVNNYNAFKGLKMKSAFGRPQRLEKVFDGRGLSFPISDGLHVAQNEDGRWLVAIIEEAKLESVIHDVREQLDTTIERIRSHGLILNGVNVNGTLLDGVRVPAEMIDLPVATNRQAWGTELVAYLEAPPRPLLTPAGYNVVVVGVETHRAREFLDLFFTAWRARTTSRRR